MMRSFFLWCCLIICLAPWQARAQSCGWADTLLISANSSQTLNISITDYFNNNLAAPDQGLCGVELHFVHQFSENLEISLTSPAGQSIQLIGNNTDDQFAFTFFTKWKITFVPCTQMAVPDSGYVAQWNNNQPNNFISGGQYDGSYYPYNGCLEDFNTGPVNGNWTLNILNNPSAYLGAILYVRLIFCDSRGVDCCFAVPGSLPDTSWATCVGDTSLLLHPEPDFSPAPADSSEYAYTYVIGQNGLLIAYDTIPDLRTYPSGTYEVCGLSYRISDTLNIPAPNGILTVDSLRNNLESFTPLFCGRMTANCIEVVIADPPPPTLLNPVICQGQSYAVGDSTFAEGGFYNIILNSFAGCDSLVQLALTVIAPVTTQIDTTICQGEFVLVNDIAYNQSGTYVSTLPAATGCDSIVTLNLTVLQPVSSDISAVICPGQSFYVDTFAFDTPGTYQVTIPSSQGCDSVVNLLLSVVDVNAQIAPPGQTYTCTDTLIGLNAGASSPAGAIQFSWTGPGTIDQSGTATPIVHAPGDYQLVITHQTLGCMDTAFVTVQADTLRPVADAGPDFVITCAQPLATLGGPATTTGSGIIYQWTSNEGHLTGAVNQAVATADSAGVYLLFVTNTVNTCFDTSFVIVSANQSIPFVDAGPDQMIDCRTDIVSLGGVVGSGIDFSWSGPCLISPITDINVQANCPGAYVLSATDPVNGCTSADSVAIILDPTAPIAMLADTAFISCITGLATIQTTGTTSGFYQWFYEGTPLGVSTLFFEPDQPGTYTLQVANLDQSCIDRDSVEVIDLCNPQASINSTDTITCTTPLANLNASVTPAGPNYTYQWFAADDDCIVSGQGTNFLRVNCGGLYTLVVTNTSLQVSDTVSINVVAQAVLPLVDAGQPDTITCAQPFAVLDGSGSASGPEITYLWTNFNSGETIGATPVVNVTQAGTYQLEITNTQNNCTNIDFVQIRAYNFVPVITFGSTVFSCDRDTFVLQAFITPNDPNYSYSWTGPHIVADADTPGVSIDSAGSYELIVVNTLSQCADTASVAVTGQICVPCVDYNPPPAFSCLTDSIGLQANLCSACSGCVFQWAASPGGIILSGDTTLTPTIGAPGVYTLTVTDTLGYFTTINVTVDAGNTPPVADAGVDVNLNCSVDFTSIGGSGTTVGPFINYHWTAVNGAPLSPPDLPQVVATQPDTYILEVLNTLNGCRSADTMVVAIDTLPPLVEAGPSDTLTCTHTVASLDGSSSATGSQYTYQWTASTGPACLQGSTTLTPLTNCEGLHTLRVTDTLNYCFAEDTVRVFRADDLPFIPLIPDGLINCEDTLAVISVAIADTLGLAYQWCALDAGGNPIPGTCQVGLTLETTTSGLYQFEISELSSGCRSQRTISVAENLTTPIVDAGLPDTVRCNQQSITLSGSATPNPNTLEILWSSPGGNAILNPNSYSPTINQGGVYYLSATHPISRCVALDSVVIAIDTLAPLANAGPDTSITCAHTSIRLAGLGSAQGGAVTYSWSASAGGAIDADPQTPTPLVSLAGTYYLTISNPNNGCTATDTLQVIDNDMLPTANIAGIDTLQFDCRTDSIMLDASASSGSGALTFQWQVVAQGNLVGDLAAPAVVASAIGAYRLIVTDTGNGCRQTLNFSLGANYDNPLIVLPNPPPISCNNDAVLLDASGSSQGPEFSAQWTNAAGTVIQTGQWQLSVSLPGAYTFTLNNEVNGCSSMQTVNVIADVNTPVAIIANPPVLDCDQPEIDLNGNGSTQGPRINYLWETIGGNIVSGADTRTLVVNAPGLYSLIVYDEINGCADTATVTVNANSLPITGLVLQITPPTCFGDADAIIDIVSVEGGVSPYFFSLDQTAFSTVNHYPNLAAGEYHLFAEDASGCAFDTTILILPPDALMVNLGPDITLQLGDSTTLEAQISVPDATLLWRPSDLFEDATALAQTVSPLETAYYSVIATNANGCIATDDIVVSVVKPRKVFVPSAFSPNGDGNNDVLMIFGGQDVTAIRKFNIFDRWGNMVFSQGPFAPNDPTYGWDGNFEGRPMNAAVFVFTAEVEFIDGWLERLEGEVILVR